MGKRDYMIKAIHEENSDNIEKAVQGLDQFTKNWCMNCKETDEKNDLVFRCSECEFVTYEDKCLVKMFAHNHKHNYNLDNFGSMGSH